MSKTGEKLFMLCLGRIFPKRVTYNTQWDMNVRHLSFDPITWSIL